LVWLWSRRSVSRTSLKEKVIFITGCDSGFGYSLALHCHKNTDLTVVAGCHNANSPGSQSLTRSSDGRIHVVDLDVTDESSVAAAVSATKKILSSDNKQLWCVVNNAATLVFADAEWQSIEMARKQLEVNTLGPLAVSKAFLPLLRESNGRIVNMISFCTDCPLPTLTMYTASKAALRSMSAGMRMELGKYGVDVVMFNPGDHPGETPLCAGQDIHYAAMEREVNAISDAEKVLKHFESYRSKFSALFPMPPLRKLDNPGYYKMFDDIATARHPKAEYTNSDWGTVGFFFLLGMLPTSLGDKARIALMRLPM